MVKSVAVVDGVADVAVYLTVAGCPMRETITKRVTDAVSRVPGVTAVRRGPRRDERRAARRDEEAPARRHRRGRNPVRPARLADPRLLRRVGQGRRRQVLGHRERSRRDGRRGLSVGVVDADIYGHSVPRMLGITARPTRVDNMIMPPQAHGREGHLHRHVHRRERRRGLARPDAAPRAEAVPRRRLLGRPGRPAARPAPGHRRHRDLGCPADPERRDAGGHHPAAGGRRGRRAGRVDRPADPPAPRRRGREHVVDGAAGRHAAWTSSAPAAARRWPTR